MSAYVVDRNHIAYLIEVARKYRGYESAFRYYHNGSWRELSIYDDEQAGEVGQMLWDENIKSVECRYPDCVDNRENMPGPIGEDFVYGEHSNQLYADMSPAQAIKACDCLEYQSCEHEEWEQSEAWSFLNRLRKNVMHALPGYDDAEWGAPEPGATIRRIV